MKRLGHGWITAVVSFFVLVSCFACSDDGQYRYRYSGGGGEWVRFVTPEDMKTMIEVCQIAPSELVMADLTGDYLAPLLKNKTCASIHRLLAAYQNSDNFEPAAMLNNPALTSNPPTLLGVKYAALSSSEWSGQFNTPGIPRQVFVDITSGSVIYSVRGWALSYPDLWGTKTTANGSMLDNLLSGMSPLLTWGDAWTSSALDDMRSNEYLFNWHVAVITGDDQLYRWDGPDSCLNCGGYALNPAGLNQVYDAFWALVPH